MQRSVSITALLSMGLLALLSACGGRPTISPENAPQFKEIVAEFDPGYSLSAFGLYDKMYRSTVQRAGGLVSDSVAKDFLDSVLVDTIAGLEAHQFDLEARWQEYRAFRERVYAALIDRFWLVTVDNAVSVDSLEARKFYEEHPEVFKVKEQVDLYHILCSPVGIFYGPDSLLVRNYSQDELWAAAEEYCNNLYRMLQFGAEIQNVAYQYSHDITSQPQGGHVGWTAKGKYLNPFDSVAFSLKPGEYSQPYSDEQGWHIVYVESKYDSGAIPIDSPGMFTAVWETTLTVKQNQRSAAIIDSLLAGLKLEFNEPLMSADLYALDDSVWLGIVNGIDTIDVRLVKGNEEPVQFGNKGENARSPVEIRKMIISKMAERFAVIQAARALGFDTLPDMVREIQDMRLRKAKTLFLLEPYAQELEPTDSMIRAYFDAHLQTFQPSKPVSVQMVTVKDSLQAEFLMAQANSGFKLSELPERFSKELGIKITYEDLGPIGPDYKAPDVYRKALATLAGNYRLAASDGAYHVLTVSRNIPMQSVEMAEGTIRIELQKLHRRQQFENLRDTLFAKYGVRFPHPMETVRLPRLGDRLAPKHK
jgi:hypothetical protein